MSHYMTALAMKQTGLKPARKIVLYWLADHHNSETGACFPSLKKLAEECEMDKATVARHLAALEAGGVISRRHRHRKNGSQSSTEYTLKMQQPPVAKRDTPCRKTQQPPVANCAPHNLGSYNLVSEPTLALAAQGDGDRFDEFWARYPRKVGKGAAQKAYAKAMNKVAHDDLMFALSQQIPSMEAKDQQYRPHASTWLNSERWNDEPEQPTSIASGSRQGGQRSAMVDAFAAVAARRSARDGQG